MGNLTDAMNKLLGPLNQRIESLEQENKGLRERVRSLEAKAGEQGEKLIEKDVTIEKLRGDKDREISRLTEALEALRCKYEQETNDLRRQLQALRDQIISLGGKPKTGDLKP